ncbi:MULTISPECIES: CsbD family protein [unclassified Marinovum]
MNWDQIEGKWEQFKGSAQKQWGELTNDQLDQAAGDRKKLEGQIQEAYGKSREEAEREVDDWLSRH